MSAERIAVVGAGIAGLTVAHRLAEAGIDVVVFEKSRGVGGRTSTRRRPPEAFDHGAQYFTCRTPAFRKHVDAWCRSGVVAAWEAPIESFGAVHPPAASGGERYVGLPGMNAMTKDLARDLRIECSQRIERIEGAPGAWRLHREGESDAAGFEGVVLATPAPQAVPLLGAAPQLAACARRVVMQPCQALMVTFAEPLGLDIGGAFVSVAPLAWVARNSSKPGRPDAAESWVLHASPEWSEAQLEASPEAVTDALLAGFAAVLGRPLPPVREASAHRWRFARVQQAIPPETQWDGSAKLGVCGDWTHGARVEDAFTSGRRLVSQMLEAR